MGSMLLLLLPPAAAAAAADGLPDPKFPKSPSPSNPVKSSPNKSVKFSIVLRVITNTELNCFWVQSYRSHSACKVCRVLLGSSEG